MILVKCTSLFITVRQLKLEIHSPEWAKGVERAFIPIPEKTASVPLDVVQLAEDVEHSRPHGIFGWLG